MTLNTKLTMFEFAALFLCIKNKELIVGVIYTDAVPRKIFESLYISKYRESGLYLNILDSGSFFDILNVKHGEVVFVTDW